MNVLDKSQFVCCGVKDSREWTETKNRLKWLLYRFLSKETGKKLCHLLEFNGYTPHEDSHAPAIKPTLRVIKKQLW